MNILITGANGQLGLSLKKVSGEYPAHRFFFTDLPEADITQRDVIDALIRESMAELIVNCAAYTAVDKAESEPCLAMKINAEGAGILAGLARKHGIPLIHISTDYVFNGEASEPLTEEEPTDPVNVYGRTKLAGEKAVRDAGCDAAVIRTSWLYSEYGNNFVKTMLRFAESGTSPRVVCDQTGTPTYAADLARTIMHLAENGIRKFETYNFSNGGQTTWYDLAREIFALAGIDAKVVAVDTASYPTAARRPRYSVLSKAKIMAAGVRVRPWQEALADCIKVLRYTGH